MGEPLTRSETDTDHVESALSQAAERLARALSRIETAFEGRSAPPITDTGLAGTLVIELDAVRRRQQELTAAAADASAVLGRAMAEVRRTLDEDAERQGVLDLELDGEPQGLEVRAGSPEEGVADPRPPEEESTA